MQTIKVPDTLDEMDLSHLPFIFALAELKKEKISVDDLDSVEVSDLNALFFGKEFEYFDMFTTQSNRDLLNNIVLSCERRKDNPIRTRIEVDGVVYVWQSDYSIMPVSFHRDVQKSDLKEKPADLLAFCYIEENMPYNKIDKSSKVILNPRHKRAETLSKHFNLAQYVQVLDFFLSSYPVLIQHYRGIQLARQAK